jgi:serine/threonine-protein kinase HipA
MTRSLAVFSNAQRVGTLREDNDLWEFEYAHEWAASAQGFDLSPALPRTQALHRDGSSNRPVQWYFDNLLPEEALRVALAKEAAIPDEDAFGLLAYFGAESAGSLVLADPASAVPAEQGLRPLALEELSHRIRKLPAVSLSHDAPKKMSLAGAQHKLLVVLRGGQLYEPLPGTPSTHILKPNHVGEDYPASAINEYFTMRLAAALGLPAPRVQRMYVPQPVYLIERFDRRLTGDAAAVERRHVIDTCQLLNKARTFKYTAARLDTLAQAIARCRSKTAARLQLYRWIVFNVLAGNGDNHLKNVSFLVDASGINAAPVYDLLCTAVYDTRALVGDKAIWPETPLALPLQDSRTFAAATRRHVLDAGKALGLNEETAARHLERMRSALIAEADKLTANIEIELERAAAASPNPREASTYTASDLRVLRAMRHIIFADMVRRLAQ